MGLVATGLALFVIAFMTSGATGALVRVWAPRFGLVDRPGGRKTHLAPTALGGGLAIWIAVVPVVATGVAAIVALGPSLPTEVSIHIGGIKKQGLELALILSAATAIMMMGLIDDRFGLGWRIRLAIQFVCASAVVAGGVRVTLFPPFSNVWLTSFLTVVWIVGLTNSFNFLDNMDELAATVGLIVAALFAAAQLIVGSLFVPAVLIVLIGALAGFLLHNRTPARLFMGDAGSNFLGFLLGSLTVAGTFYREGFSKSSVLSPLLVMAVPLYDTTSVILIRLREGRSPFQADRRHLSHRLVDRGLTPRQAVGAIALVTLAAGLGALLLPALGVAGALVVAAQTTLILGVVAILETSNGVPPGVDQNDPAHADTIGLMNNQLPISINTMHSDILYEGSLESSEGALVDPNSHVDTMREELNDGREAIGFATEGDRPDGQN